MAVPRVLHHQPSSLSSISVAASYLYYQYLVPPNNANQQPDFFRNALGRGTGRFVE